MQAVKYFAWAVVTMMIVAMAEPYALAGEDDRVWNAPWRFHFNLYGWLPDAPATIDVKGQEVVDVPEDLDTILDSLDMTAMFEVEVHKGPVFAFANVVYYDGEYDERFIGPLSGLSRKLTLEEEVWAIKYGAGYRVGKWQLGSDPDAPVLALYPWVGGFYFHDDYEVKVDPAGVVLDGVKINGTFKFNTPMAGLGARLDFWERWYLNLSYSYGGWDVDNVDEIWDFIGNIGYRFDMWGVSSKVFAGYRYLSFDHDQRDTRIQLDAKGPFFGIGWEF